MKYFSLFSGVGGFELAINNVYENRVRSRNGETSQGDGKSDSLEPSLQTTDENTQRQGDSPSTIKSGDSGEVLCVGFSEIDKYAISVYQYHYKHKNYGDISQIDWNTVPDFDLVVGGSPCQDLSVAGKQKGLSGARSGLFFEFVRCLKEKQPTNFIWENVKGALSSSSGWDFARVQIEFSEAGYDIEWQVLNAKDFGVPQNRERIFVVGHLRGKSEPKVFPIRTSNSEDTRSVGEDVAYAIDSNYWKGTNTTEKSRRSIVQVNQPTHSNDRVYSDDGISPSLNTMQGGRRQPKVLAWSKSHRTGKSEADKRRKNYGQIEQRIKTNGEFNTLSAGDGGGNQSTKNFIAEDTKIRRLTPLECERLMSWPDYWTKEPNISDTQRYKMCGNGVVSKVVEAIIERL